MSDDPPKYSDSQEQAIELTHPVPYNPEYGRAVPTIGTYPVGTVISYVPQSQIAAGQTVIQNPEFQETPPAIVVQAPQYNNYESDDEYVTEKLSCWRGFQAAAAVGVLCLQSLLLAYIERDYFYWIWLLLIPMCSIYGNIKYGCSRNKGSTQSDTIFAILWLLYCGAVAGIYFGYYPIQPQYVWFGYVMATISMGFLCAVLHFLANCYFPGKKRNVYL